MRKSIGYRRSRVHRWWHGSRHHPDRPEPRLRRNNRHDGRLPPTTSAAKASTKATDGTAKTKGSGVESGQNAAAAKALGITEAELKTAVQGGKTIAQVATDGGVAVDKVITAMVDDMKAKVAAALTAGTITQAKADEELADEPKETTDKVNNVNKGRGGKGSHRSGCRSAS